MKFNDEKTWWQVTKWYVIILFAYFLGRIVYDYAFCHA